MTRFLRITAIVCSLLLTLSLLGCSSNQESSKKTEKEVKPAATETSKETNNKVVQAGETSQNKTEEKASTESKNTAPSKQANSSNTQQTVTSANNTNSNNTSKVSSNTAAAKPNSTAPASSPTTNSSNTKEKPQEPAATVTLSVEGPKDRGTIIAASQVSFKDGDTVYGVLLQVAKKQNIVVDSSGSGSTTYIQGIDNIYEFDHGAKSGWVFKLNGVSLTKSVGSTNVKDGDRIECYYTE